eukprot:Clim_evm125s109 gene=Clim_evmTU125s109
MTSSQQFGGQDINTIVFDLDFEYLRCGFAGEDTPRLMIPSCVVVQTLNEDEKRQAAAEADKLKLSANSSGGNPKKSAEGGPATDQKGEDANGTITTAGDTEGVKENQAFRQNLIRTLDSDGNVEEERLKPYLTLKREDEAASLIRDGQARILGLGTSPDDFEILRRLVQDYIHRHGSSEPQGDGEDADGTRESAESPRFKIVPVCNEHGEVMDWEILELLVRYAMRPLSGLCVEDVRHHPVLWAECNWATRAQRQGIARLFFDRLQSPVLYFAKRGVLTAFANGRSTALVVDCGIEGASVVSVVDGSVLGRPIVRNGLGAHFIQGQYLLDLMESASKAKEAPDVLAPGLRAALEYLSMHAKEFIENAAKKGGAANATSANGGQRKTKSRKAAQGDDATTSGSMARAVLEQAIPAQFKEYAQLQLMRDVHNHIGQVMEYPYNEDEVKQLPQPSYEFPGRVTVAYGPERFAIPEGLFQPEEYCIDTQWQHPLLGRPLAGTIRYSGESSGQKLQALGLSSGSSKNVAAASSAAEPKTTDTTADAVGGSAENNGGAEGGATAPTTEGGEATAGAGPAERASAASAEANGDADPGDAMDVSGAAEKRNGTDIDGAEAEKVSNPVQRGLIGVVDMILETLEVCHVDLRPSLYAGIILTGAMSLTPGFVERVHNDVVQQAPMGTRVKFSAQSSTVERRHAAWIGGSIMASLSTTNQLWCNRKEWIENPDIFDEKCP